MSERRNRSCPEITFIEKEINQNKNKSFWLTEIIVQTFQLETPGLPSGKKVEARLGRDIIDLVSPDIYNYLDQIIDFLEDHGTEPLNRRLILTMGDSFVNGIFKVNEADNPAEDAGGLQRQVLTTLNKNLDDEDFFKLASDGKITTTIVNKNKLRSVLAVLLCLYNTGEGTFKSKFKFGHVINIYKGIYPDINLAKIMSGEIKNFAIKVLKEDREKVTALTPNHYRMNTYLWLMTEFIDEGFKVQEGTNCAEIVVANTTGEYEGMYSFIFEGANWDDSEAGGGEAPVEDNVPVLEDNFPQEHKHYLYD